MKSSDLPEGFIQVRAIFSQSFLLLTNNDLQQVFRLANSFTMKTVELVNLSTRIDDILSDLFTLSNL